VRIDEAATIVALVIFLGICCIPILMMRKWRK
jgi:hypothetical protein